MNKKFSQTNLHLNGYMIENSGVSEKDLMQVKIAYQDIYAKARKKEYPYIRVYDDFLGKLNISSIEMPFHPDIINHEVISFINKTNIIKIAKAYLGNDIKMTLSRFHMTGNKSHVGEWHRDCEIGKKNTLQISLFFYDEKGLEVIDGSHTREMDFQEEINFNKNSYCPMPGSRHLQAKAGEVLIMNPALLHRAISADERANIHFRFEIDNEYELKPYSNDAGFNDEWVTVMANKNTVIISPDIKKFTYKNSFKTTIMQIVKTFIHYFVFFLPMCSIIYRRTGAYPSLKLRKLFSLNS